MIILRLGGTLRCGLFQSKGNECVWRLIPTRLLSDWEKGYIKVKKNVSKHIPISIVYSICPMSDKRLKWDIAHLRD